MMSERWWTEYRQEAVELAQSYAVMPCPMCGSHAGAWHMQMVPPGNAPVTGATVFCLNRKCGIVLPVWYGEDVEDKVAEAVRRWNRRSNFHQLN